MFVKLPLHAYQTKRHDQVELESIFIDPAHIIKVVVTNRKHDQVKVTWTAALHDTAGGVTEVFLGGALQAEAVQRWLQQFIGEPEILEVPSSDEPSDADLPLPGNR